MNANKYDEYKISISEKNKKIVDDYLNKINNFITDNNLENDLYFDIEERVFEKLSAHKNITQLQTIQILNEIWKPEDIFEIDENDNKLNLIKIIKNLKNKSVKTVSKIFETWFNFNNLLTLIKTILKYLLDKIKYLIKNFSYLVKKAFKFLLNILKYFYDKFFFIIKKIFFFFVTFFWYVTIIFAFFLLIGLPLLMYWVEIWNTDYFSIVNTEFKITYLFSIIFILAFGLYFIIKKRFLIHFLISWISFALIIGFAFVGITKIYNNYSYEWEITQNFTLDTDKETIYIDDNNIDVYGRLYLATEFSNDYKFDVKPSETDQILVEVKTKIFTKSNETLKEVESKLNDFDVNLDDDKLILKVKENDFFKEKHNFVPAHREIIIYVPKNKILDLNFNWYSYSIMDQLNKCLEWENSNDNYYDFNLWNVNWEIICIKKADLE